MEFSKYSAKQLIVFRKPLKLVLSKINLNPVRSLLTLNSLSYCSLNSNIYNNYKFYISYLIILNKNVLHFSKKNFKFF